MADDFTSTFEALWIDLRARWCDCHDLGGALALSHEEVKTEFFHRVVRVNVDVARVKGLIDDAIHHFQTKGFPCAFTLSPLDRPDSLADQLMQRGFVSGKQASAMGCESPAALPAVDRAVSVEVVPADAYGTWADLVCRSFQLPTAMGHIGRSVLIAPETRLYLARVDGMPAGTTLLHTAFGMGYVDLVGTLPEMRRKGVASALVRQAVADSVKMGNRWTALEVVSDSVAERLYRRLGFRVVHHRQRFTLPAV